MHPVHRPASRRALFLDRDGTLILDKHYLFDPAGVELIPGVAGALQRATSLGYQLFLFTNQAGVARGLHSLDDLQRTALMSAADAHAQSMSLGAMRV